jgi:hypothetical protein
MLIALVHAVYAPAVGTDRLLERQLEEVGGTLLIGIECGLAV